MAKMFSKGMFKIIEDDAVPPGTAIMFDASQFRIGQDPSGKCYIMPPASKGLRDAADAFRYTTLYNTEKIKDKMRRGILWEGWLAAARRNARNG